MPNLSFRHACAEGCLLLGNALAAERGEELSGALIERAVVVVADRTGEGLANQDRKCILDASDPAVRQRRCTGRASSVISKSLHAGRAADYNGCCDAPWQHNTATGCLGLDYRDAQGVAGKAFATQRLVKPASPWQYWVTQ